MSCSHCKTKGHNIRTCPLLKDPVLNDCLDIDDCSTVKYEEELDSSDVMMGIGELLEDPLECMVCYENIDNESVTLKCGHIYCVTCFVSHMRLTNTCAACRAEICEPPKKPKIRGFSQTQICDIVEETLNENPEFIQTMHDDLLKQTKKFLKEKYKDTTDRQRCQMAIMIKQAISSTNLNFSLWLAGIHIAHTIDAHYTEAEV